MEENTPRVKFTLPSRETATTVLKSPWTVMAILVSLFVLIGLLIFSIVIALQAQSEAHTLLQQVQRHDGLIAEAVASNTTLKHGLGQVGRLAREPMSALELLQARVQALEAAPAGPATAAAPAGPVVITAPAPVVAAA